MTINHTTTSSEASAHYYKFGGIFLEILGFFKYSKSFVYIYYGGGLITDHSRDRK